MSYRTIKVAWSPRSRSAWQVFTALRMEAGKLWSDLVEKHHAVRCQQTKWPSKADLQKELKGQYPNLHSQSIQQLIADFCEAVDSARQLKKPALRLDIRGGNPVITRLFSLTKEPR